MSQITDKCLKFQTHVSILKKMSKLLKHHSKQQDRVLKVSLCWPNKRLFSWILMKIWEFFRHLAVVYPVSGCGATADCTGCGATTDCTGCGDQQCVPGYGDPTVCTGCGDPQCVPGRWSRCSTSTTTCPLPHYPGTITTTPVPTMSEVATCTAVSGSGGEFTGLLLVTKRTSANMLISDTTKNTKNSKIHEISHFPCSETTTLRHLKRRKCLKMSRNVSKCQKITNFSEIL